MFKTPLSVRFPGRTPAGFDLGHGQQHPFCEIYPARKIGLNQLEIELNSVIAKGYGSPHAFYIW